MLSCDTRKQLEATVNLGWTMDPLYARHADIVSFQLTLGLPRYNLIISQRALIHTTSTMLVTVKRENGEGQIKGLKLHLYSSLDD